ncbi:hypothetical protein [Rhabdochromatium marinum]|uniref:hypothetical protein n=1 Tax=Rhabdochromatium marinum TaxID=48729 RepID=UPI001F5BBC7D|nr:hypothetical protein [Rhabdochromatium marinum]
MLAIFVPVIERWPIGQGQGADLRVFLNPGALLGRELETRLLIVFLLINRIRCKLGHQHQSGLIVVVEN